MKQRKVTSGGKGEMRLEGQAGMGGGKGSSAGGGQREKSLRLRMCEIALSLAVALVLSAVSFYLCFISFDFVGVPTTKFIIRRMMPRPEHFKKNQNNVIDIKKEESKTVLPKSMLQRMAEAEEGFYSLRVEGVTEDERFIKKSALQRSKSQGAVSFNYHRPSLTKYGNHQWLWDSCFHSIVSTSFAHWHRNLVQHQHDGEEGGETTTTTPSSSPAAAQQHHYYLDDAKAELRSLLKMQNPATGFIPEMIYWHPDPNQHGIAGAMFGYSFDGAMTDLTQMPMMHYPIKRIAAFVFGEETFTSSDIIPSSPASAPAAPVEKDLSSLLFLMEVIPKVFSYYNDYWLDRRDPDRNGLVSIIHPWESGLDASPLYDAAHGIDVAQLGQPPTPEQLYPNFIVLLYRYRHRCNWNLKCIQELPDRFDVEDVGVNSILADGFRVLSEVIDRVLLAHWEDAVMGWTETVPGDDVAKGEEAAQSHSLRTVLPFLKWEKSYWIDLSKKSMNSFQKLKKAIIQHCWDSETKRFVSHGWIPLPNIHKKSILVPNTVQSLFPLLLVEEEAGGVGGRPGGDDLHWIEALLEDLENPTTYGLNNKNKNDNTANEKLITAPVPTTAFNEMSFNPEDSTLMWRGPSWPTTNWFVMEALDRMSNLKKSPGKKSKEDAKEEVEEKPRLHDEESRREAVIDKASELQKILYRKWQKLTVDQGFYEYYNPLTSSGMGQKGLGMGYAFLDFFVRW